jgi:hypothetical protein
VTFSFVIKVAGNEVSAATIPCDGSRYVNTIVQDGPRGRVEIIPGRDNDYKKMTAAYLVVAPR